MSDKQTVRLPQIDQVLIRRVGDGFRISVMAAGRPSPVDLDCDTKEEVAAVTAGFAVLMRDGDGSGLTAQQRSIVAAFSQSPASTLALTRAHAGEQEGGQGTTAPAGGSTIAAAFE